MRVRSSAGISKWTTGFMVMRLRLLFWACRKRTTRQVFVEDDGVAHRAVRIERVARDHSNFGPASIAIQGFGGIAAFRVEDQQREASGSCAIFDLLHQHPAESPTACATVDEELGDVGAMLLVRHRCATQLNSSRNSLRIASDEEDRAFTRVGDALAPPVLRRLQRQRIEKADRGAG